MLSFKHMKPVDQCIVLPFRPQTTERFNGVGLALHFLLGNVMVLHSSLKEMWFGWRLKKLFPDQNQFQRFCRNSTPALDHAAVGKKQQIRFCLYGTFTRQMVTIGLADANHPETPLPQAVLDIDDGDGLIRFRLQVLQWLAAIGHPFPKTQMQPALWAEKIDGEGLGALGRALEYFYLESAYAEEITPGMVDIERFEKLVASAPQSYLARNLYGWALYRNKNYAAARNAFLTALDFNPAGAGAMSGLRWCAIFEGNLEEALSWSQRQAKTCDRDVQAAKIASQRQFEKANR
jgi:hypothetical protein